jgi:DNA repair protein SbcC/Rad50
MYELEMWKRATGEYPHHIDLAQVRFGEYSLTSENYVLPKIESIPKPDKHTPESFAKEVKVPLINPWLAEGQIHVFHILRDNLDLLYKLLEEWKIVSLGQIEKFLNSTASDKVIIEKEYRDLLKGRCQTAKAWISAWRRGRNKPVDRIVLEKSGIITEKFIDQLSERVDSLNGKGIDIIPSLRENKIPRLRTITIDALEEWLEDEGYILHEKPLTNNERQQETLFATVEQSAPEDIIKVISWLESATDF